jgi:hypothetical protein
MTIPSQVSMKRCTACGQVKPMGEYYIRTNGKPHGHCRVCYKARINAARAANRAHYRTVQNAWNRPYKDRVRDLVFKAYGGYRCACCGETERKFLTLDHVNNDGAADRMKIAGKRTASGWTTYRYLWKHKFPPGYQILCMNCNFGKRMNKGVCPHRERCND